MESNNKQVNDTLDVEVYNSGELELVKLKAQIEDFREQLIGCVKDALNATGRSKYYIQKYATYL